MLRSVETRREAAAALLLAASGAAALIDQTLWVKQLSLVVGVDVYAVAIAVSGFFAGLAIGGAALGRLADSARSPLMLYALLEVGIGVLGVGTTRVLASAAPIFVACEHSSGFLAWGLPFVLVGAPACLMGGTLPVLLKALRITGPLGTAGGRLYAANTAGAIVGTLLTAFVLVPRFGVLGSSFVAAGFNGLAAVGAIVWATWDRGAAAVGDSEPGPEFSPSPRPAGYGLAMGLYAVAGGIALGYEVVWSQVVVQWTSTRTFAFAVVLAVYLAGLAIGSALFARWADRNKDPWGRFGLLIAAAGAAALLEVTLLGPWLAEVQRTVAGWAFAATGQESAAMAARFLTAAGAIVLLPTILLGAAFPAALRLLGDAPRAGHDAGRLLACNMIGGIVGTLTTGFVLVPALGLERTMAALAVGAVIVGSTAAFRGTSLNTGVTAVLGGIVVIAAAATSPALLGSLLAESRGGKLLFHEAGPGGTVAVLRQGTGQNTFRRLYIQGVSNSGDSMTSLRYMRLQALLPLLIHRGEPRSALVIGLGTGITTGSLLAYDGLERRVCAELMPAVVRAAPLFEGNTGVASDPRVEIRLRDGRRELLRSDDRYDLVTLEPPPPSAAGVVNLYSRDFYELAASRLEEQGLVAQWLPLPTQGEPETRSLIRSFLDVFPHASLWTTEIHEMLLVGSRSPMELDAARITARFEQPGVSAALQEVGIDSPAALLATFVCDRAGLVQYAGDAPPVTDDRPRIESGPWVLPGEFERTLVHLLELQSEPPLAGGSPDFPGAVVRTRQTLHAFYAAALYAYERDRSKWSETLDGVLRAEPHNPYYRWIAGREPARGPP